MYGGFTSIGALDTDTFRFGREGYAERATTRLIGITANSICKSRQAFRTADGHGHLWWIGHKLPASSAWGLEQADHPKDRLERIMVN